MALSSFKPENYEDDIQLVEMRSLGRGRGFKVVREYSALEDETLMTRISSRLHSLLNVIEIDEKDELRTVFTQLEEMARSSKARRIRIAAYKD